MEPEVTNLEGLAGGLPTPASSPADRAARVRQALGQGVLSLAEAGRELLAAKAEVPHGSWLRWLAEEVEISVRAADQLMRLAMVEPNLLLQLASVADLSPGVAFELASPSTPRVVLDGVVNGSIPPKIREVRAASRSVRGEGAHRTPSPARTLDPDSAADGFARALSRLDEACGGSDARAAKFVARGYRLTFKDRDDIAAWAALVYEIADAMAEAAGVSSA